MPSLSATAQTDLQGHPSTEEIRTHLERVLVSPEFAGAPRLGRFLSFVVETALAGNSEQIKESLVAIEVYGRRPDYNPQIDSTVRVEAGRLRARLRDYQESSGKQDAVQIELPKGTYAPVFRSRPSSAISDCNSDPSPQPPPSRTIAQFRKWHVPAAAASLVICGTIYLGLRTGISKSAAIDSLAVLPFVNLGNDRAAGPFCEGLTEELTTLLGRDAGVRVAARTTMARYKDGAADIGRIGKDHGVRAVLEGSVRQDGDHVVVTAQLIDTRNGYHLWADRYERNAGNLPGAQREVAAIVVSRLQKLVRGEIPLRSQELAADPKMIELYHRATDLLRIPVIKNGPPGKLPGTVLEAVRLFREITARAPGFAQGWAGLAEAAEWEYELRGNQPRERLAEAKSAAQRAVELEPDLVEGWTILTSILFFREWNFQEAEASCRRAIELDPRNIKARRRYVDILRMQGRGEEARREIELAIEQQPAAAPLRVTRALMLYERGEYDRALQEARTAADLTNLMPAFPMALWIQGLCLEQKGRLSEAESTFRLALVHQPHAPWVEPSLGHLLARTNRTAPAEDILAELRSHLDQGRLTYAAQALVHTALGRADEALECLERGVSERDDAVLTVVQDPRLRPLRSDPRFQTIVESLSSRRTITMPITAIPNLSSY